MAGILVLGEAPGGALDSTTAELIALGRRLGDSASLEVAVALPSHDSEVAAQEAVARGADRVYVAEHPLLREPLPDAYLEAYQSICNRVGPTVVLVAKTPLGRDVGPRLAFRLGVALAQDCVEVKMDPDTKRVTATRPVYGGNAMASVTFPDRDPQVVLVRNMVYEPLEADPGRSGTIEKVDIDLDPTKVKTRLVETVTRQAEGVRLEDAPVVVGGGRGLGGPEPFQLLQELADLLGGAVGASRAACDAGWIDHSYQIGLTGKTISPNLYITVGISGASQHMAGCSGAKNIVSINTDPEANIFKEARFGVVGDWKKVLPAFIETVRELVKS